MTDQLFQSPITLLIVDDSESDRVTYSRYLQSDSENAYRIIESETLEEGLELWRSQQPDIVLIDLNLPDGDGLEFLEAINVEHTGERVPVIMLTGLGNERKAVRAMKLGAADYLVKVDITAKSLTTTVKQVLRETLLSRQLWRAQKQQLLIAEIALRIREFLKLEDISKALVKEVRQFIKADRAAIYQFNPDMSGTIVAEDIVSPWQPCLKVQVEDTCFRESLGGAYCDGRIFVANDIYAANLTDCHIKLLERFQVRANLVVPILLRDANKRILWGLLILHQCSAPRIWLESDVQLLQQLAVQLSISIQQAIAYQQIQTELAERKRVEALLLGHQAELEERNQLLEIISADLECTVEELRVSTEELIAQHRQLEYEQIRYQNLFNFAPDGYLVTDISGRIGEANQAILDLLAINHKSLLGQLLASFIDSDHEEIFYNQFNSLLSPNQLEATWEINITPRQGKSFPAEISVTKNITSNSNNAQLLWIVRNISDRKCAEQALLQLNQSLEAKVLERTQELWQVNKLQRAILDGTDYAIISTDLNGIIQTFNTGAEKMLGYSMGEVVGQVTPEIFYDSQELLAKITKASTILGKDLGGGFGALISMAMHGLIDEEWTNIHKDGSRFSTSVSVTVLKDDNDQPIGLLSVRRNISDRKVAEKALKQQLAAIEAAIDGIAILQDNNYIYLNPAHLKMFGYQHPDELLGKTWTDLYSSKEMSRFEQEVFPLLLRDHSWQGDAIAIRKDGSSFDEGLSLTITEDGLLICVCRDISDRKQAEAQMLQANAELLRATKLKDEFLANMSHELRTPLNSILGLSEALQEQILGSLNDKQLKSIATIESSGEHLLSLINDILDLSKISAGMIELDIASVSVRNLCSSSLAFVKQQAFTKRIQINSNIPTHINKINIDERRIKQVLINLLTNAVKFTPTEGNVHLLVASGSGHTWQGEATVPQRLRDMNSPMILFQVVDTGIGISANDLQRLFQPFVQIDSALNRQYEGTGLGLALVKQIVELHGGQVMVESEVGKGSCFTVALPYEMSPLNDIASNLTTSSSLDVITDNAPLILLAEDNEANIQTLTVYLTAINYRVIIARTGIEAVAQAQANLPDIILIDIQMPTLDGLEATKRIRLDPNLINTPIIALTALAMEGDREKCLAAGANEYLSKPIKFSQLNAVIQQVLT